MLGLLEDLVSQQVGIVITRFSDESFRRKHFKFHEYELPAWYNYINASSQVVRLLEKRIPEVIERILRDDEDNKRHIDDMRNRLHSKMEELARHFDSAMQTREEIGRTNRISASGSVVFTIEQGLGLCGAGMTGSFFLTAVFSRLSFSLLTGLSVFSFLGLGAVAGISSLFHAYKELNYHRDKDGFIVQLALDIFQKTYLRHVESDVVLNSCIRKMYTEVREHICTILDKEIPNILEENRDFLKVVQNDLISPEEMRARLETANLYQRRLHAQLAKFKAENGLFLLDPAQLTNTGAILSRCGRYSVESCTVVIEGTVVPAAIWRIKRTDNVMDVMKTLEMCTVMRLVLYYH